jgi:hypothetical protein
MTKVNLRRSASAASGRAHVGELGERLLAIVVLRAFAAGGLGPHFAAGDDFLVLPLSLL